MRVNTPLNKILNSQTKIRVLRFFCSAGGEITGRQVAKMLQTASTPVQAALRDLFNEGVLDRQGFGRAFAYRLNRQNWVVANILIPMFRQEAEYPKVLQDRICKSVEKTSLKAAILSVVMFGSVVNAQERATSDIDLLVIVKNNSNKETIQDLFLQMNRDMIRETGLNIDARIYALSEFKNKHVEGVGFIKTAIRSHLLIFGEQLEALV
jgi:predicted nucleotidyltransferase